MIRSPAAILPGITRAALLSVAAGLPLKIEERAFTVDEALSAKEAFLTSSTNFVMPVTRINETTIGDGRPGDVSIKLVDAYWAYVEGATGRAAR